MKDVKIYFDWIQPINKRARARKHDPQTSHDAAKRVELGKAEQQRQWIYQIKHGGRVRYITELASLQFRWATYELGKRIGEIEGIMPTGEVRNGSRVWGLA